MLVINNNEIQAIETLIHMGLSITLRKMEGILRIVPSTSNMFITNFSSPEISKSEELFWHDVYGHMDVYTSVQDFLYNVTDAVTLEIDLQ